MINFITISRVILLVPLVWLLAITRGQTWGAVEIFALAGVTDFLDGYLARRLNQTSAFGAMLDQICDKIFIIGALVAMAAAGLLLKLMLVPIFLIIARELAVAGLREYAAQCARPIPVDQLGKLKTTLQFCAILLMLVPANYLTYIVWINHLGTLMLWIAAAIGLLSAWRYFTAIRSP